MENMVTVFLFGKKYEVPDSLTIMEAMEYSGYRLVRGCGCRNGFCGACATIYRIAGDRELKACLACSTRVENNMYVATLPFFPLVKEVYDMEKLKPTQTVMMQLYPEIYACVGCNACTKACTQGLNVMQYIVCSPIEKLYTFVVKEDVLGELKNLTKAYLDEYHYERELAILTELAQKYHISWFVVKSPARLTKNAGAALAVGALPGAAGAVHLARQRPLPGAVLRKGKLQRRKALAAPGVPVQLPLRPRGILH